MRTFLLLLFLVLSSCKDSGPVHPPKELVEEEKMAQIIAEFALSDQATFLNSGGNLEISTRYILNQHKVSAKAFEDSYNYYIASPRVMESILSEAQDIIVSQDPAAKAHIKKKLEEIGQTPTFN